MFPLAIVVVFSVDTIEAYPSSVIIINIHIIVTETLMNEQYSLQKAYNLTT